MVIENGRVAALRPPADIVPHDQSGFISEPIARSIHKRRAIDGGRFARRVRAKR
jgi:hypothetical protein